MTEKTTPILDWPQELAPLTVFDALEIGPVRVDARRITCPYTIVRQGERESTDLTFSYEEKVLDPANPADVNLASMITAQVAMNYGLFCREMVFHGSFSRTDQRFLTNMARNTAREIYVNKFLMPNPFLTGEVAELPVVKRRHHLQAYLAFPGPVFKDTPLDTPRKKACAVLSSGGKESLLSHALLSEIGQEVHPVFINESGRHWFTALNSYRHFQKEVPNTARVWTNADRVFAWMLRRIPFIRKDFANVRSDDYPIRLWTVAILVFGSLPILARRGIGRLVVGNEHDTTRRVYHQGLSHYDGLYDQSIFFDQALTAFFQAKGYGLTQFSLLRPLSELLVLKTLVERYPDLQRDQISCHAAHKEGERIRPCGKCEKCRRIVSMLLALGADPSRCGYTTEQIADCLSTMQRKGVHQESEGAEHLLHLLAKRGLLEEGIAAPRPRPEVMRLRFDPMRSPMDAIPADLQPLVYDLFMEYAQGAVRRKGKRWTQFDPLLELDAGDGLHHREGACLINAPKAVHDQEHILGALTWPRAEVRLNQVDLALLPVGALEQHGPHLPLDTDAFDADLLAREVAAGCQSPRPLVLPLIPYGVSYHHQDFPGTIGVSPDTLAAMVYEVGMAAASHGITKLVIINGHGGNEPALHFAAQKINRDAAIFTTVDSGETSDTDIEALVETRNDVHAGEIETSTSLATRPELVDMEQITPCVPRFSSQYLDFSSKRSLSWYAYTTRISATGVMGDPTIATAEKGKAIWEIMVSRLTEFVEHIKSMSLDDIHQRRY